MGIGSASLDVPDSGEGRLLGALARSWPGRSEVTVIDVGAHAGSYTRATRAAFGPRARIHCFEPNPALFSSLLPRLAGDAGTTCHQVALGRAVGTATLFLDQPGSSRGSLIRETFDITRRPPAHSHEVSVKTLDQAARELGIDHIDLLKIDVEGHELAVLQGAEELLGRNAVDVVQFEFGERNLASRTYLRDFWELLGPRYSFFRVTPRGLVPIQYRPSCEVFALETNYVAVAGDTTGLTA
jgi:FkbM family methyltransferase